MGPEAIYCGRSLSNNGADTVEEKQVLKGTQTEASLENSSNRQMGKVLKMFILFILWSKYIQYSDQEYIQYFGVQNYNFSIKEKLSPKGWSSLLCNSLMICQ